MELKETPATTACENWPRLMHNKMTGFLFLVPSCADEAIATDLRTGKQHPVGPMRKNLVELPAGYSVTLTNT